MKHRIIRFSSIADFRKRIVSLWQNQKDDESYEFQFANETIEIEFNRLIECFAEGQQGGSVSTVND